MVRPDAAGHEPVVADKVQATEALPARLNVGSSMIETNLRFPLGKYDAKAVRIGLRNPADSINRYRPWWHITVAE